MINKTFVPFGANIKLTLVGNPEEVTTEVARLTNYGAIVEPPDDYHEGQDCKVTVDSSRARLIRALIAQADVALQFDPTAQHTMRRKSRKFQAAVLFRASRMLRTYERRGGAWAIGTDYAVGTVKAESGFGNGE